MLTLKKIEKKIMKIYHFFLKKISLAPPPTQGPSMASTEEKETIHSYYRYYLRLVSQFFRI